MKIEVIENVDGTITLMGDAIGQWGIRTTFLLDENNELLELPF